MESLPLFPSWPTAPRVPHPRFQPDRIFFHSTGSFFTPMLNFFNNCDQICHSGMLNFMQKYQKPRPSIMADEIVV
jgi:hypothetical protein